MMSNRKQEQEKKQKVVLVEVENIVETLRANGLDNDYIMGLFIAVIRGHIKNGTFTEEYLQAVEELARKREIGKPVIVNSDGQTISSTNIPKIVISK